MFVLHVENFKARTMFAPKSRGQKKPTEACKLRKFCEILRKPIEENNDGF